MSVSLSQCMSVFMFVWLFVCLSLCLSVFKFVCLSVCLSVYLYIFFLSVCLFPFSLSLCLFVFLSLCLPLCLSNCLSVCLCLTAFLSFWLSFFHLALGLHMKQYGFNFIFQNGATIFCWPKSLSICWARPAWKILSSRFWLRPMLPVSWVWCGPSTLSPRTWSTSPTSSSNTVGGIQTPSKSRTSFRFFSRFLNKSEYSVSRLMGSLIMWSLIMLSFG